MVIESVFTLTLLAVFPSNSDSTFKKVAKVTTLNQMKKYAMKMSVQKTPV